MSRESSSRRIIFVVLATLALALGLGVKLRGQSTTNGAINGTVEDSQELAIPKANITIENEGTGFKDSATTNGSGGFSFDLVQPGVYTITITAPNFADYVQTGVTVEVGRASTVVVKMTVAGQKQTVQVSGEPPQVNTTDQSFANSVGNIDVSNLPTYQRRWSSFVLLEPAVTPDPDGYQDIDFRGINGYMNNNTIDGGDNNQDFFAEERGRTRIAYTVSLDSVDDFQVNTSDYSPQYGRSAGGVINTVTKSGTNQFHGDAFYYFKDNAIAAHNPFTYESELVNGSVQNVSIKPPFRRQQYGGSIGGPILKNKIFFFFTYDAQHLFFPIVEIPSNPNFFNTITIPTGASVPTCSNAYTTPTIAASFQSTATEVNALYCRGVTQTQVNNAFNFLLGLTGQFPRTGNQNIEFPKIDWHLTPNNIFTISYNRMRWASPGGIQTNATADYGIYSIGNDYVHDDILIARLNSVLSGNLTNELLFQYGKDFEFEFSQAPGGGEPTTGAGGLTPEIFISPTGTTNPGTLELGTPSYLNRLKYPLELRQQYSDTISWIKGTHLLKFGIDVNHVGDTEETLANVEGTYNYTSQTYNLADFITDYATWTASSSSPAPSPGCTTTGGVSIPCYHSYSQAFGPLNFQFATDDIGLFAQDSWKITPRVTVNYGLRWDYERLPQPLYANPNLPPSSHFPSNPTNFGPRVGVAWDIFGDGKTSLRAGYGVYYGRISNGTIFDAFADTAAPDAQGSESFTNSNSAAAAGEPVFPNTLAPATVSPGSLSPYFFDHNDRVPMIQEADVSVQRQIGDNFVLTLSYLFTYGRFLPVTVDQNLNQQNSEEGSFAVSGGPYNGQTFMLPLTFGPRPDPTATSGIKGFTSFVNEITDWVHSNYNAGVVELSRHLSRGLELEMSYTWAHALDDQQGDSGFPSDSFDNQFNPNLDYGNSTFDVRNRFVGSAVWSPEHFASGSLAHRLLDDWTVAPVLTLSSNLGYSAAVSGSLSALPGGLSTGNNATTLYGQSGSSLFPLTGRNAYHLPFVQYMDLHIGRKFHFGETKVFEVDAECNNLFNKMIPISVSTTTAYTLSSLQPTTSPTNYILTYVGGTNGFGVPNAVADDVYDVRQFQFVGRFTF